MKKLGVICSLLAIVAVTMFPPLVSPNGIVIPGYFSFTGSRGFLLDPSPMVYYEKTAEGGMAGNGTVVDTGRLLSEIVFFGALGLLFQSCGRCSRQKHD